MELLFVDSRGLSPVDIRPRIIATLHLSVDELVERGLPPFEVMSGPGASFFLVFVWGEARGYLEQLMEPEDGEQTEIAVQGEADDAAILHAVLEAAAADLSDCAVIADHIDRAAFTRWTVWRQDDNGNRDVVETHTGRRKAERAVKRYEARGHKQLYWVEVAREGQPISRG